MRRLVVTLSLLLCAGIVHAQNLLMVRSVESFPETMLSLQTAIGEQGYRISRVQRVDIGLTASGFETDKYRIVFFGKPEEVRSLTAKYPQLIPYLPQKITIFAEGEDTLLVSLDPEMYKGMVDDEEVKAVFDRWRHDTQIIMDKIRE